MSVREPSPSSSAVSSPPPPPPPPPRRAAPPRPDEREPVRSQQSPVTDEEQSLDAIFDIETLRKRLASWGGYRVRPRAGEQDSVSLTDLFGRFSGRGSVQEGEEPRWCYCGNAHYHKVAGAPLWICSTCHPPARGARVTEQRVLAREGELS